MYYHVCYLILFDIIWWQEMISTFDWIPLDSWTIQRTFQTLRARPQLSSGTDHSESFGGVYWCRFYRCYFMLFYLYFYLFPSAPCFEDFRRYYWEPFCFFGMLGCFADGKNVECRFCGSGDFIDVTCKTTTTTTTTSSTTTMPGKAILEQSAVNLGSLDWSESSTIVFAPIDIIGVL